MSVLDAVLDAVRDERRRQDKRWGEQNHPDGTGGEHYVGMANWARESADAHADTGDLTWMHILREEVYEAFAESDEARLVGELIQVQAVAAAWIEAIMRRRKGATSKYLARLEADEPSLCDLVCHPEYGACCGGREVAR